jgi:hypothetical protein
MPSSLLRNRLWKHPRKDGRTTGEPVALRQTTWFRAGGTEAQYGTTARIELRPIKMKEG